MEKTEKLNKLKIHVESMDKHHQIEVLKILSKNLCKINENKSGVYINMTFLEDPIIKEIEDYLLYVSKKNLITTEYQRKSLKHTLMK